MNYVKRILNETFTKAMIAILALVILAGIGVAVNSGANARTQYQAGGTGTTSTPVFNEFYDVPGGVGDEADFVRVKPKAGGNGAYVNSLSDACMTGAAFTVRTYVHNGADPTFNEGTATAIARDTVVAMNVETFNQVQKNFDFTSTISSSNAASMTDSAELKCAEDVILKLVPASVQTYSKPLGFQGAPDSSVNGTLRIGSRVQGSGDVYACWDDRVIVVYEVVVEKKPEVVLHPAVCEALLAVVLTNNQVRIDEVEYTANDAVVNNVTITYGDGNSETLAFNQLPKTHTYASAGSYDIRATLNTTFQGQAQPVTSEKCVKKVKIEEKPKISKECIILETKKISRVAYQVTAEAKVQNTTVQKYVFTTTNGNGAIVDTKEVVTNSLSATYDFFQVNEGTYTVKAVITTADGVAEGKCETKIKVEKENKTPEYACKDFNLKLNGKEATVSFIPVATNGATFKSSVVRYYANDSKDAVKEITTNAVNSEGKVVTVYTYTTDVAKARAEATLQFSIGSGKDAYTKEVKCQGQVLGATTTTPPAEIPNTGAGSAIVAFLAVIAAAGTALHRRFTLNR